MEKEIAALEERKRLLKLEIEEVTQELLAAYEKQKKYMQEQDVKRASVYGEKGVIKERINEKERHLQECQLGRSLLQQLQHIIGTTEAQMNVALSRQITELAKKRDQFDHHFLEILRDHCRYEEDRLNAYAPGILSPLIPPASRDGIKFTSPTRMSAVCGVSHLLWGANINMWGRGGDPWPGDG